MIHEEKSKCSPCCLFKLPVGSGPAKPGQVTGDPGGAVSREGRCERAKVEGSSQGSVQPQFSEVARGNRDASAPRPERAIERPEFRETPARRVDDWRVAGHRLADGPVAGLGYQGVGRGDQVAAVPFGRAQQVEVLQGSCRRGVITHKVDPLGRIGLQTLPIEVILAVPAHVEKLIYFYVG